MVDVTMTYQDPSGDPQIYYKRKPAIGIAISMDAGGSNIGWRSHRQKLRGLQKTLPAGLELNRIESTAYRYGIHRRFLSILI